MRRACIADDKIYSPFDIIGFCRALDDPKNTTYNCQRATTKYVLEHLSGLE
jgi:hypothetical protein